MPGDHAIVADYTLEDLDQTLASIR